MKFLLILWISKFIAWAVNLIDKKRGSSYSGQIAVKLMPNFVAHFKAIDYQKTVFITGTNGKSTTTNLMAHTMKVNGKSVAANIEGANMMSGVATALIKNSTLFGKFNKEYLILEIDERSLPLIREVLPGIHMGITNLQKDQVQRNGDPDFILRKFKASIGKDMALYLNNEEPRSRSLEDYAGRVFYFGVKPNARSYVRHNFDTVSIPCPHCGHPIVFQQYNLASIGSFTCSKCSYASIAKPDVLITDVDFEGCRFTCDGANWKITYNNPFYIYNYAMIIGICRNLGLTDQEIQHGFETFVNPANHDNVFRYHGKEIRYIRAKQENPEALQSQLDLVAADKRRKAIFIGLHEVKDFYPYYCGSFYFFDCDFTPIVESNVEHYVSFSTTVCYDVASRMILAGAPEDQVTIMDTDAPEKVFSKLEDIQSDVIYVITNMKHVKEFKKFFLEGGADHE